jgi:hypothetical protein
MQKKQKNTLLIAALCAVFLIIVLVMLKSTMKKNASFHFEGETPITQSSQFSVNMYLDNESKDGEITAYDVHLDYDKTKAKLVSAESGGYLSNPLVVKWDVDSAWFAASANPGSYKDSTSRTNAGKPVLVLTFVALDTTDSSVLSLKDESEVYVAQKGGMNASKAQFHFSIK